MPVRENRPCCCRGKAVTVNRRNQETTETLHASWQGRVCRTVSSPRAWIDALLLVSPLFGRNPEVEPIFGADWQFCQFPKRCGAHNFAIVGVCYVTNLSWFHLVSLPLNGPVHAAKTIRFKAENGTDDHEN